MSRPLKLTLKYAALAPILAGLWGCATAAKATEVAQPAQRCETFAQAMRGHWPDGSTRVVSAAYVPEGAAGAPGPGRFQYASSAVLKAHCDILAVMAERKGVDGQPYAIKFHLRLPLDWNGRFLFQGGGGTNGDVGDALGATAGVGLHQPALSQGYAVVSQDSGHDNAVNTDFAKGGMAAFGFDPQARRNYAYASLKAVTDAAKAAIAQFYNRPPRYSYFAGCSKGGQEGLALVHRYPDAFDGVVAAAPGMSLPRAAIAQTWDAQTFASLAAVDAQGLRSMDSLSQTFSPGDFSLVRNAVLAACDAEDGLADGVVSHYGRCSVSAVASALRTVTCSDAKDARCLSPRQVQALARSLAGPSRSDGTKLYTTWPWDAGIGAPGWAVWKIGLADAGVPPLSVVVAGPALNAIFQSPPSAPAPDPRLILQQQMAYDFDRDPQAIYRTVEPFEQSGWDMMSGRSPDIDGFRAKGGKLIVPHGVSDPVFSINDTVEWYQEVDARYGGAAQDTVRVFPVPGMGHCEGGPATDQYDAFAALVDWVERGRAPEYLNGLATAASPWPGRTRPLCRYPKYARYKGQGDPERKESFECVS